MLRPFSKAAVSLLPAAAVSGAVIMAVEVLGARMLSVGFGASLAVWGAMICVTLVALAAGYLAGGILADRCPRPPFVPAILVAAGALIAVAPHLRGALRLCCDTLGLQWGALAASVIVFFLPLGLLGMVSPFAIKLMTGAGGRVGLTAGGVYAVSTIGSAAGTLLAAFWLIPTFGLAACFRIVAATAALAGAAGWLAAWGPRSTAALIVPLTIALVPGGAARVGQSWQAPDGTRVVVEAIHDSRFGRIAVLTKGDYRLLTVDGIAQTGMPKDPAQVQRGQGLRDGCYQELVAYTVTDPDRRSALVIGLAGGMTATLLESHGIRTDCVDLDPAMAATARQWFGFTGSAVVADGRRYLESCAERYDFCLLDAYNGDVLPAHLSSVEAVQAAKRVLKPDGMLVVNYIGYPGGQVFACVVTTLRRVFANTLALRSEAGDDVQAITVFAGDRPIEFNRGWLDDPMEFSGVDPVSEAIARSAVEPSGAGFVLTDDYNPIDYLRAREAMRWRERTVANIGNGGMF